MPSIRTCIHSPSQIEIKTLRPKSDSGQISSSPTCSCFKKVNPVLSFQFRAPLSLAFQFWNPISYFSLFLGFSTNRHRHHALPRPPLHNFLLPSSCSPSSWYNLVGSLIWKRSVLWFLGICQRYLLQFLMKQLASSLAKGLEGLF
uniref:uncharacterized protein LOC101303148 isoform X2 n=1 Tax=Fragaria vesca subsp. vesca TaxID=101020 RepID=UPI0005C98875|nr:PREDICTED: uncharacterized protein LOC101303148 isoform X2 [Fragaria vesca subsp. vesca]